MSLETDAGLGGGSAKACRPGGARAGWPSRGTRAVYSGGPALLTCWTPSCRSAVPSWERLIKSVRLLLENSREWARGLAARELPFSRKHQSLKIWASFGKNSRKSWCFLVAMALAPDQPIPVWSLRFPGEAFRSQVHRKLDARRPAGWAQVGAPSCTLWQPEGVSVGAAAPALVLPRRGWPAGVHWHRPSADFQWGRAPHACGSDSSEFG